MKRLISLVMVLVLMLGSLALVPVNAAQTEDIAETSASSWYSLYNDFIYYDGYRDYFQYDGFDQIKYMLHDMNFDGKPELLIYNGAGYMAGSTIHVFAVKNNRIVHAGTVGRRSCIMFYNMNSSYRGLYCHDGNMGYYSCYYYYMKNYKIVQKHVFTSIVDINGVRIEVENKTLYSAYKKATTYNKERYNYSGSREKKYELKSYTWYDIYYTLGYKNFVGKYQYLAIPKIKDFDNVNGGVKITWNKVKGAAKYRLYRKTKSGWTKVATTSKTSYTHKISKSNTTYTYTVRCVSSDGTRNTSRFVGKGYKHKYIATPKPRSIKNSKSGIRFEFSRVSGAPKYRIFRKTSGSSWRKVADVSSKKNYYFDKTAKKGVRYTYTVRCVSSSGKSFVSGFSKKGLSVTRK